MTQHYIIESPEVSAALKLQSLCMSFQALAFWGAHPSRVLLYSASRRIAPSVLGHSLGTSYLAFGLSPPLLRTLCFSEFVFIRVHSWFHPFSFITP